MAAHQVGGLPVVEGDRLVGIFTERDVLTRVVAAGRAPDDTRVTDVMSSDLVVAEVVELRRLPVENAAEPGAAPDRARSGRLAGILSLRDLLAADIDDKAEAITLLNAYVHYIPVDLQSKLRT